MHLWTQRVEALSHDVLVLMGLLSNSTRTHFVAKTSGGRFEVLSVTTRNGSDISCGLNIPLKDSYCGLIHQQNLEQLIVEDAQHDPRVSQLQITYDARIGSYVGVPIRLVDHSVFGTLCSVDPLDHQASSVPIEGLKRLASILERALAAEYLAHVDQLSGLFNRLYLNELMATEESEPVVMMAIDIDNFKRINDEYGHQVGDDVIRQFGKLVKQVFSMGNSFRLGGDEFCVLMDAECGPQIGDLYQQLLERIQSEMDYPVAISCGVARAGTDLSELMIQSDEALYQAKHRGKSTLVHYA